MDRFQPVRRSRRRWRRVTHACLSGPCRPTESPLRDTHARYCPDAQTYVHSYKQIHSYTTRYVLHWIPYHVIKSIFFFIPHTRRSTRRNEPHGSRRLPHHLVQTVRHAKGQPGLDEVSPQLRAHIGIPFRANRRQLGQVDGLHKRYDTMELQSCSVSYCSIYLN